MSIDQRLGDLHRAQTNALAEFYACTKALERADERVRLLNQQIAVLTDLRNEGTNDDID